VTAPKSDHNQKITLKLVAIFFCGLLALGVQQQPVCSWLQGITLLIADPENLDKVKSSSGKRIQEIKKKLKPKNSKK
jgi:hypothetical protein